MHEEDRDLILEVLDNILWALNQIQKRFSVIHSPDDFLDSDEGIEKLDSICMQLINIGEALKQVDKLTTKSLLVNYPEVEWKKVMGMRDILSHHYFDIDAETVYTVSEEHVPQLFNVITEMKADYSKNR